MRIFFTILIFFSLHAQATNYYFSTLSGDDSRAVPTAAAPWKTIAKLNSINTTIKPGDSILFKRDETFYGKIIVMRSGTKDQVIYYGPYGVGQKPIITGFTAITSWTSLGNGIYESNAINAQSPVAMVLINGFVHGMGRYPNADSLNGGYLTYTAHTASSITSTQLSGGPKFVGAQVVIRQIRWVLDKCTVTNQTANTVTFSKVSAYTPHDGYGFFFQNALNTLDEFGEWYYNNATGKLDVFFGTRSPNNYNTRASTIDTLVRLQGGRTYCVFELLRLQGGNVDNFYSIGGSNITVRRCDALYAGQNGIATQATQYATIDSCQVNYCNDQGIYVQNPSGGQAYCKVINCIVRNTGTIAGAGESNSGGYTNIVIYGGYNLVQNCVSDSSGYVGIHFVAGDSITILNNYITNWCFIKNDGGGIYTWNDVGGAGPPAKRDVFRDKNGKALQSAVDYYGSKIIGNVLVGAGTADAGTPYYPEDVRKIWGSHGIYLDGNSANMEVANNSIAYCGKGIFVHDNRNMNIHENTVYDAKESQIDILYEIGYLPPIRNIRIKNNIFYSNNTSQNIVQYRTILNDVDSMTISDSNFYGQTIAGYNLLFAQWQVGTLTYSQKYDMGGWQAAYHKDQNSTTASAYVAPYTARPTSQNLDTNGSFNQGTAGTICINAAKTCVSSWDNTGKLDGGCYRLSYSGTSASTTTTNVIVQNVGAVSSNKSYLLRYSVLGTKNNATLGVYLRSNYTYKRLIPAIIYTGIGVSRQDNETLLQPNISDPNGQIIFQFADRDSTQYLDNIQLYEAVATVNNPDNFMRFEYNATQNQKTVLLGTTSYIAPDHKTYTGTITLNPYSSIILLKQ